ncbi:hypothetical protein NA56DRAFT_686025 [Hyaloscypha hepaticicola]|uniref:Heterokaryon incompatibility domain-containing protein n=1 Tax=Hyaloscypha hepaticicola TaxID=2082293 RepID=A0A2J6QGR5_9HELO|nr:hypothetical protein NA56DRAFT_686025 [Hyaloscypha hepaticicola]
MSGGEPNLLKPVVTKSMPGRLSSTLNPCHSSISKPLVLSSTNANTGYKTPLLFKWPDPPRNCINTRLCRPRRRSGYLNFCLAWKAIQSPVCCALSIGPTYRYMKPISYAWGNPKAKCPVIVDGKRLDVTVNLRTGLKHFRYHGRSRVLWVDAICINQTDIPELGMQVTQMQKIYQKAKTVLIWVGADSEDHQARVAIDSIITVLDFLSERLGIPVPDLGSVDNLYQVMVKARDILPVPNECDFSSEALWKSLLWFYKHQYFTRVWAIQEVNANKDRLLHCGLEKVMWDRVSLVACYITMETAFSKAYGFTNAHCWCAATVTTDLVQPRNWLLMLYLASNYFSLDPRDVIYGLRGMMKIDKGAELLKPDYTKSVDEVYRDTVEAAFVNFDTTDILLYVKGTENPSWVPRWEIPMLFRNPFRFGKPLPWRPAGETNPVWNIDKKLNILSLSGFIIGSIKFVEPYNKSYFRNEMGTQYIDSPLLWPGERF